MAKFKVVLECEGRQRAHFVEADDLEQCKLIAEVSADIANAFCEMTGKAKGQVASIEEVSNGNKN